MKTPYTMKVKIDVEDLRALLDDERATQHVERLLRFAWRVAVICLLGLLLALQVCCVPRGHARTVAEQDAAAVALRSPCGSTASGVIVSAREILTAGHFVVGCPSSIYLARDAAGAEYYVRPDAVNDHDVARLRVLEGQADLHGGRPRVARAAGTVCIVAGQPARRRSCGHVVTTRPGEFLHTAPTVPGNSGSGIYDRAGRLVGIVSTCVSLAGVCTPTGGTAGSSAGMIR